MATVAAESPRPGTSRGLRQQDDRTSGRSLGFLDGLRVLGPSGRECGIHGFLEYRCPSIPGAVDLISWGLGAQPNRSVGGPP